jgi:choline-sulfatase
MGKKPNVLFIMTDQLSALAVGCLGNDIVRTPNIDKLASQGSSFNNCYCNSPICGPSRWSLMTGQYVHNHKGWDNGACLSSEEPTFAHGMTLAGYETVICSRMHFHGPDQHHGYEKRLATEHNNPIIYGSEGFGTKNYDIPEYDGIKKTENKLTYPVNVSPRVMHDDYVLEKAVEYLHSKSWADRPFMLTASFLAPHGAVKGRKEYELLFQEYMNMDLGAKYLTEKEFQKLHPHAKRLISNGSSKVKVNSKERNHILLAEYYSRVTYFDQQIGVLLDTLQDEGLSDDTAIIFTSDHGDCMGRGGHWGKSSFYEKSAKVPLIISLPMEYRSNQYQENVLRNNVVSLVDIFPTLLTLADAPRPDYDLPGKSLIPLVQNENNSLTNVAFSEYYGIYAKNAMFMVRKDDYKLNYYVNEPSELFNLTDDPNENKNLINDPAYKKNKIELETILRGICNPEAEQEEYLRSHHKRSFIADSIASSRQTKQRMKDYIHDYRAKWNESTWDGNKEQGRHEWHLK